MNRFGYRFLYWVFIHVFVCFVVVCQEKIFKKPAAGSAKKSRGGATAKKDIELKVQSFEFPWEFTYQKFLSQVTVKANIKMFFMSSEGCQAVKTAASEILPIVRQSIPEMSDAKTSYLNFVKQQKDKEKQAQIHSNKIPAEWKDCIHLFK